MNDLGTITHLEAIDRLCPVNAKTIIDIGCGDGWLCEALAKRGANVTGVEPDSQQAENNLAKPKVDSIRFLQGAAESLPLDSGAYDGVIFHFSLHHVPSAEMANAIHEAHRVLQQDGFLYIAEPIARGPFQDVMQPFHDETEVRRLALEALYEVASPLFVNEEMYTYTINREYADFEAFVDEMSPLGYHSQRREDVASDTVRKRFVQYKTDDGFCLSQPVRINFYHIKKT